MLGSGQHGLYVLKRFSVRKYFGVINQYLPQIKNQKELSPMAGHLFVPVGESFLCTYCEIGQKLIFAAQRRQSPRRAG